MSADPLKTSLQIPDPAKLGLDAAGDYVLFNFHQRTAARISGATLSQALTDISVPGQNLQLFSVRPAPKDGPLHLWGGKRISESWDAKQRKMIVQLHGPPGLQETVILAPGTTAIRELLVEGKKAAFFLDPEKQLIHGLVTFTGRSLGLEAICAGDGIQLPTSPLSPGPLSELIIRNTLRHRLRTTLTVFTMAVAILAFCLLRTVVEAWYIGVAAASPDRLVTRSPGVADLSAAHRLSSEDPAGGRGAQGSLRQLVWRGLY